MELPKHFYGTVELNHHVLRKESESVFVVLLFVVLKTFLFIDKIMIIDFSKKEKSKKQKAKRYV
jgi:hypothetical protein